MKQNGVNLARQAILQVEENTVSLEMVNKMIEEKIRIVGKDVMIDQKNLSNDLLKKIAKDLGVDEIYWYSPEGTIIYSNIDAYLGWTALKGHPVENFRISRKNELMEGIRKDTESDNYNKYGYLRNADGSFIQIGIRANEVEKLTRKFNYQTLVEKLAQEENIVHVLLVDKNFKTIADSNIKDVGIVYDKDKEQEMQEALKGNISTKDSYYTKADTKVLTIYFPVTQNGEINNVLVLSLSTGKVYYSIYMLFIRSSIIAIIMVLMLLWVKNKNIIKPVNQLNQCINQVDIEKNIKYRLSLVEGDTFLGVASSINNILDKTEDYFFQIKEHQQELEASNEEISATYQQLAASDEELRAQYDEIQNYTEKLEDLKEKLEYIAYHDFLTDLPNRRKFIKKLEEEISENKSGVVMLLDLDNFKGINDTLGHSYGDKVLKKVAEELENIKDERMFVSRFGGDEFFVLIEGEKDAAEIENYAKRITNIFKNKLIIEEEEIYISCSMGITLYPFDSHEVIQLLMNADMAMYKVKNAGKNSYMFFNETMTEKLREKLKVERILREAIKKDELKLLYQPQVCTFTGKVVGFEALLRLKNSSISPGQFIPVAEEMGMIIELGRWVTKEAINQISMWKKKGFDIKPIAINFSAKQLNDLNYIEFLENTLKEANVEAKYIDIEITESIFLEKKEETIVFVNQLKALGVKIALDDFGTGYSSLSYLTFLPVDKIKLDKSLNDKFLELENIKVMYSLVSLAHSLNLEVVAEGIEEVSQYRSLKVASCNYIQGYLFSKPLEIEEAEKIYHDNFLDKIH
ncbi:EAL domain-containing protein [Clostridium sp. OS1-26]|uniref:EAL domain-containing protein n=1 Tax=Clostridium sp. OS1-26 TaxID=3070681 RepID=UPI0027E03F75|nr:EAL domain-containing protein [Clostridium sp. OS1-26]WML32807.1 EAL domain-containing protein [Clostridium sp. OS1-26]